MTDMTGGTILAFCGVCGGSIDADDTDRVVHDADRVHWMCGACFAFICERGVTPNFAADFDAPRWPALSATEVLEAIRDGVEAGVINAMPYPGEILMAIADGARDAHNQRTENR
jgi:hypothetical protein